MLLPLKKKRKLCVMKKDTHMSPPPEKKNHLTERMSRIVVLREPICCARWVVFLHLESYCHWALYFFFKKVIKETRAWKDEKLLCHVKRCSLAPFIEKTNHLIKKMSKIVMFEQHTCHAWRERLRSVMYFAFENREKYCVIYFEPFLF